MFIFERERERERETEHEQGKGRERETQNLKQAPGSELSAQSPTQGPNPQAVRSRPEPKSVLNQLSHQAPRISNILKRAIDLRF